MYLIFSNSIDEERNKQSSDSSNTIRHPHQNTSIPWSDVKVIDIETRNSKPTAGHPDRQSNRRTSSVIVSGRVGNYQEKERFHSEPSAIEQLSYIGRSHSSRLTQMICQQSTAWYYYRH